MIANQDEREPACKPGSVRSETRLGRGGHSSGTIVADRLKQPTRTTDLETGLERLSAPVVPIRLCSRWGLPCRPRRRVRGALLPHPFTLTPNGPGRRSGAASGAVCFLWHCPWGRPRRTLSGTVVPWSPDFPPQAKRPGAAARAADERDVGLSAEQRQPPTAYRHCGLRPLTITPPGNKPMPQGLSEAP